MTRAPAARRGAAAAALAAIVLGAVPAGQRPAPAAGAPHGHVQAGEGITYALADTWRDVPWAAAAGRYRRVRDISSAPDGTRYVVDSRDVGFVHVLPPGGAPGWIVAADAVAAGADEDWLPCRVDVGAGGQVYVLSKVASCTSNHARLDRLAPDGTWVEEVPLGGDNNGYNDVAVRADGRLFLSRFGITEGRGLGQVDVLGSDGALREVLSPPELGLPVAVDVAADGTVYIVSRVEDFDSAPPPPGPQPTAEPSLADAPAQPGVPVDGVVVLAPDHRVRATFPFVTADEMDVAVGEAGVFVSRGTEIFRLGERAPLYTGPTGHWGSVALDAPADGRLLGALNHCHFRGVVEIAAPAAPRPPVRLIGALDRPDLEGPVYPVRLAAGEAVAVLQGGYDMWGEQPDLQYSTLYATEQPQVVQRWARAGVPADAPQGATSTAGSGGWGRLRSQLGLCSDGASLATRDVAVDGGTVYTVDAFNTLLARPDDLPPAWSLVLDAAVDADPPWRSVALAAGSGVVVVLDGAAGRVARVDATGTVVDVWDAGLDAGGLAVDVALDGAGGQVYLADQGAARVVVRGLDGGDRGSFALPDGPARVAAGPGGDVFVLGRGGWGFRYRPDGTLLAAWPMPRRDVDPLDIAVDVDGRVYVSYLRRLGHDAPPTWLSFGGFDILEAGVWVFDAEPAGEPEAPAAGCVARGDKGAAPARLPLGDTVTVTLAVDGWCPDAVDPLRLVIVLDASGSMNKEGALDRAEAAALTLLGALDTRTTETALIAFGDGATTLVPLTPGMGAVAARLSAVTAGGDSRLAPALGAATALLGAAPVRDGGRRAAVILTDAVIKDAPRAAAARATAAGIDLYAIVVDNSEIQDLGDGPLIDLEDLTGGAENVLFEPDGRAIVRFAQRMAGRRTAAGLFETLGVEDVVPVNMDYVPGSARPPAAYDPARRTLTWALADVDGRAASALTYRLRPRQVGRWPTNVSAVGVYRDALGKAGRIVFPVPTVDVAAPPLRPAYLPMALRQGCVRPGRPSDVLLVIDTSLSMAEPAPGGGQTKLEAARVAAGVLVDLLDPGADRVAVVAFNRTATVVLPPTGDAARVRAALAGLAVDAGTRIDLGLATAADVLATSGRPDARAAVILLTDGLQSTDGVPQGAVLAEADRLKAAGAWVHAVGLGDAIDQPLLRAIASDPDRFHASPTAGDLEAIYRRISERLACGGG